MFWEASLAGQGVPMRRQLESVLQWRTADSSLQLGHAADRAES